MKPISIPQVNLDDYWDGTTGVQCSCGGIIEWAEAAYSPGIRACRSCLAMYKVRGKRDNRELVPQTIGDEHIEDAEEDGQELRGLKPSSMSVTADIVSSD